MTFTPVVAPAILLVLAAAAIVLRLITMRQLATRRPQRWTTVWRWSGLTLAVVLILIAAARPAIGHGEQEGVSAQPADGRPNVFLVVDRSADLAPIRGDVTALVDRYPGARFALITFGARPAQEWPLSEDSWSLKPMVAEIEPYADDAGDVNAAAASNILRYQLIAAGQRHPGAPNLVYYFGSGAPGSEAPQGEFDPVARSVDGGAVFGYGGARNEPGLRQIAEQLGVPYVPRVDARPVSEVIPDQDRVSAEVSGTPPQAPDRTDLYWVFTMVAAALLLFEIYLTVREFRASRSARRDVAL